MRRENCGRKADSNESYELSFSLAGAQKVFCV